MEQLYKQVIETLKQRPMNGDELALYKRDLCHKMGVGRIPSNIDILLHATPSDLKQIKLVTKPGRSLSGVSVVTIMTAPIPCAHGKCTFCPGGPQSIFGSVPQSYTGNEPASMRAIRAGYDPYIQVFNRLEQYVVTGHPLDKIELIFNGGTFTSMPQTYQDWFVTEAFRAFNDFSSLFYAPELDILKFKEFFELPGEHKDVERVKRIHQKILQMKKDAVMSEEQHRNETAKARVVAMCIETKPDWAFEPHIDNMLRYGTTRVELGVQTLSDDILFRTNRGHDLSDTRKSVQLLKDSLLKVGFHMMPGMPGSNKEQDIADFAGIFADADFRPDALKIYPTMVMPGTPLFDDWKAGKFTPLTLMEAADVITEAYRYIPEWCRVMRVQRDIPTKVTTAGVDRTNLRQYVDELAAKKGIVLRDIRAREPRTTELDWSSVKINSTVYESSGGTDIFISADEEKHDKLLGFCRLRIPFKPHRPEFTSKTAGIRELHVYGAEAAVGGEGAVQHRGLGMQLVKEAEKIAAEQYDKNKMLIISGVGAREYYKRKLGYEQAGAYVGKGI